MPDVDEPTRELFELLYAAFNSRDIDAVLDKLAIDVRWPNGWEGGYIQGHEEVRSYWIRQWAEIDPTVIPVDFAVDSQGRIDVAVHQVVRDRNGELLSDAIVHHVYLLHDDEIARMDIRG